MEMATYIFLNTVLLSLNKKLLVGSIFCDFQKASDCVNHNILLNKLEFYGISGIAFKLVRSYLDSRYHRVIIKNKNTNKQSSEWELVKHGVPEGSILGPLLFLVHINGFALTINRVAEVILFADENKHYNLKYKTRRI